MLSIEYWETWPTCVDLQLTSFLPPEADAKSPFRFFSKQFSKPVQLLAWHTRSSHDGHYNQHDFFIGNDLAIEKDQVL